MNNEQLREKIVFPLNQANLMPWRIQEDLKLSQGQLLEMQLLETRLLDTFLGISTARQKNVICSTEKNMPYVFHVSISSSW
jgi:hypothetical protein